MPGLTRRQVLSLTGRLLSLGTISSVFASKIVWAQTNDAAIDVRHLAMLIHDLYPHDEMGDPFYTKLAQLVKPRLEGSEGAYAEFVAQLDARTGGVWQSLDPSKRSEILADLADQPFFAKLRDTVRQVVYVQPEVWALIGYGGNALAQGGYINRGFNDIDWLEETR
ncbi:MAG: hypothetical protein EPO31_11610 [Gammaproteobacteria bacterium]|jgi:hypothetical protein|nr:MAG: hypothetical protein EPO31_11610 [Gammaproteobacteria bacterium]